MCYAYRLFFALLFLTGCGIKSKDVVKPPAIFGGGLTQEGASTWIRMPYPDSKFEPGSVVVIRDRDARWIGHIRDCGVPPDLLIPVTGDIGDFTSKVNRSYTAQALLKIGGVEAGPEFSRIRTVELVQNEMSADSLSL